MSDVKKKDSKAAPAAKPKDGVKDSSAAPPADSNKSKIDPVLTPANKKDLENKTPAPVTPTQEQKNASKGKGTFLQRNKLKLICATMFAAIVVSIATVPASSFFGKAANYNMLSNQTFTFASTMQASVFKTNAGARSFVKAVCAPINIPTDSINAIQVLGEQSYNNTYVVTLVTLYFGSWDISSNDFRDKVKAKLRTGYLSQWEVVAFGEGYQVPKSFCPPEHYGLSCKKCGECGDPLICDDGALGSGECKCPSVFMSQSYFPYPGAGLAKGRCLTLSADRIVTPNIAVETDQKYLANITIWNVGSTEETFSGAVVLPAPNMTSAVQSFTSISFPISWPQTLSPGDFLMVSILLKPADAGCFYANSLLFVDNDDSVWWDDANTQVDLNFCGTIAGQLPKNGTIRGQFALYRIDSGNGDSGILNGNTYANDAWFGSFSSVVTSARLGNPVLATYRTFKEVTDGSPLQHYVFPTKYAGDISVNLIFRDLTSTKVGQTAFNIYINNQQQNVDPVDPFAALGTNEYLNLSFSLPNFAGSQIAIYFEPIASMGTPFVNAIEILQTLDINITDFNNIGGGQVINYAEALHKSILFFETIRSGPMQNDRRLLWRSDSCMECIGVGNRSLSGGYYEAGGNYMKFNFPMAWSLGQVAWGIVEHPAGFKKAKNYDHALKTIKIGADYLIDSYINDQTIVMSVGAAIRNDFSYFGPPELYAKYVKYRPIWYITPNPLNRSSETCGAVAAFLAQSSMAFKDTDTAYAAQLLSYAKKYYDFGDTYRGSYKDGTGLGFREIQQLYPSNSYKDEMAEAALWLYRATGEQAYLQDARDWYDGYQADVSGCGFGYSWEEKGPALHVLFAYIDTANPSRLNIYRSNAKCYFDQWLPGPSRTVPHTPRGLAYRLPWGSTRYAANTAWIAHLYAKYLKAQGSSSTQNYQASLIAYAANQTNYILGATGRSYMSELGVLNPQYMTHKSSYASILYFPLRNMTLSAIQKEFQASLYPQVHRCYGAVVGGPIRVNGLPSDFFIDSRVQYQYTEPALDYNACITALVAAYCETGTCKPIDDSSLDLGQNFKPPRP